MRSLCSVTTLCASNPTGFPLFPKPLTFNPPLLIPLPLVSLVVFTISIVIISKHSQTASLNSHLSSITLGVNGLTNS